MHRSIRIQRSIDERVLQVRVNPSYANIPRVHIVLRMLEFTRLMNMCVRLHVCLHICMYLVLLCALFRILSGHVCIQYGLVHLYIPSTHLKKTNNRGVVALTIIVKR